MVLLSDSIERFEFIISLVVGSYYLQLMSLLSTVLQAVDIDYVKAMNEVKMLIDLLNGTNTHASAEHG